MVNKNIIYIRILHSIITMVIILSIIYLFYSFFTGKADIFLYIAITILLLEGLALVLAKGICPMVFIHRKFGDEKSFWDMFFDDRYIPYIDNFLKISAFIGFCLVIWKFWLKLI